MYKGQQGGVGVCGKRGGDLVDAHWLAPVVLHHDRRGAAAFDVLLHAPAEHAVLAHDDLVARGDEVDETRFHTRRARGGDGQGQFIAGLEGELQQRLDLVHQFHEQGVQVADRGTRQGAQHTRGHVGGTGSHQGAAGRVKRLAHCCLAPGRVKVRKIRANLADFAQELKQPPEYPVFARPMPALQPLS